MKWLLAFLLAGQCLQTAAQTGQWSDDYHMPGVYGRAYAVGSWNGQLVAGGQGFQSRGAYPDHLAIYDGVDWAPIGDGVSDRVRAIVEYQGDLIVAGNFTGAGGATANGVARWDGTQWHPLGDGVELSWRPFEPGVFAMAVYNGELYVAGQIDLAGGVAINGIARWDGSEWHDVGGGLTGGFEPKVLALHADTASGLLYVGGEFEQAGGTPAEKIAVWNGSSWSAVGDGFPGPDPNGVHSLHVFQGEICAGGVFSDAGGNSDGAHIACFDGADWQPLGGGIPDWDISVGISSMEVFDGDLYVGGDFIEVGGVGGTLSRAVARWDGAQWHSVGGVDGTDLATTAIAMTIHNSQLIVGGEFKWAGISLDYGEAVHSRGVVAFDGSAWHGLGTGLGAQAVDRILRWNGKTVITGGFWTAGGNLVGRIAIFENGDWQHFATFDRAINDAVVFEGDLVVTGEFNEVDGQPVASAVRYDGVNWSSIGTGAGGDVLEVYAGQLYAGGLGGARRWSGSSWETFGDQLFGQVYDMHAHADGKLYIGGFMTGVNHIVSWDGTTMATPGGGANNTVVTLYSHGDDLLVGGEFTQAGGNVVEHFGIWDGSDWSQFGPGLPNTVHSIGEFQGDLWVGGNFTTQMGAPANFLVRWDGAQWADTGAQLNAIPLDFLPDEDNGVLHIAGSFTKAGGFPAFGLTDYVISDPQMIFKHDFE